MILAMFTRHLHSGVFPISVHFPYVPKVSLFLYLNPGKAELFLRQYFHQPKQD